MGPFWLIATRASCLSPSPPKTSSASLGVTPTAETPRGEDERLRVVSTTPPAKERWAALLQGG